MSVMCACIYACGCEDPGQPACMYVCMYIGMHACVYDVHACHGHGHCHWCMYTCMYVCIVTYLKRFLRTRAYLKLFIHTKAYLDWFIHTRAIMYGRVLNTYILLRHDMYACLHKYIHTYRTLDTYLKQFMRTRVIKYWSEAYIYTLHVCIYTHADDLPSTDWCGLEVVNQISYW